MVDLICEICSRNKLRKVFMVENINLCCKCFKVYSNALKLSLLET